ncbi:enoyl-CoA hydratase/isomerase family protein [Chloroflexota bacterium]
MIDYSAYKYIIVEKKDKVAVVTLNRPDSLNAVIVPEGHAELEDIWIDLNRDEEVNAIVLTGAGRGFCSGADVKGQARKVSEMTPSQRVDLYRLGFWRGEGYPRGGGPPVMRIIYNTLNVRQPIIAAVNGAAIGMGATLALFCDIIIASEKARFGDTHIKVGLVPGDGGTVIWPLLCGIARAKEYLWTGDIISAAEAERIGLVNYVVPHDELMPKAMEWANRLAHGPSTAIEMTKRALNKRLRDEVNLVLDYSDVAQYLSYFTDDHKEGPRAFVEKREPHFTGH